MKLLKLVPDHTNLDFMRWRNLALVLSTLLTVASLAYTAYRGLNLGVDFVGGQLIRVTFAQPIDVEQLRGRVDGMHLGEASIQEFGGPKTFQVRLPKPEGGDAASNVAATQVKQMIEANYPGARIDAVETVSGKVSGFGCPWIGLPPPPAYWDPRLLAVPDGYVYDVITNGIRNMPPYKYQIPVADRWAIIAYFRALQRSQHATQNDVPGAVRSGH